MMEKLLLFISLIGVSLCQVTFLGRCKDKQVQANFDIDQYVGEWYSERSFIFERTKELKCVTSLITKVDNTNITLGNSGRNIRTGRPISITGTGRIRDPSTPAKISTMFSPFGRPGTYWVLDTDYTNYAVVYSCENKGIFRSETVWIFSRRRTQFLPIRINQIYAKLESLGINADFLTISNQRNCDPAP